MFFDVLGLEYQYEPDKFETPEGRYIPDFWLPWLGENDGAYLEVKGAPPDDGAIAKAIGLHEQTGSYVYVAHGGIGSHNLLSVTDSVDTEFDDYNFYQCVLCGHIDIEPQRIGASCSCCSDYQAIIAKAYNIDRLFMDFRREEGKPRIGGDFSSPMLEVAYEAAKSARFESLGHKETVKASKDLCARLREWWVFAKPLKVIDLFEFAHDLSIDPRCPRFVPKRKNTIDVVGSLSTAAGVPIMSGMRDTMGE